jgi:hypothetical protein
MMPSASFPETLELKLAPDEELELEAPDEDWELPMDISSSEKLLALRARLLRSFPSLPLLLAVSMPLPWTGLSSRSKPNCSKERLKEVALAGRVRCS